MINYIQEGNSAYYQDEKIKQLIGDVTKSDTIRVDDSTVEDVVYQFDFDLGQYVEQSRVSREDILIVPKTELELLQERLQATEDALMFLMDMQMGGV